MRRGVPKVLVTGGAGFIGSAFMRQAIKSGMRVVLCDKLTYAGDLARLKQVKGKYVFYKVDICDPRAVEKLFKKEKPEFVVNFAAETHVDRSIVDPSAFLRTNFIGTQVLLDAARKTAVKKFIQISTDEVYGDIERGSFKESSPLKPNSPYAASKAAADLLIRSYIRTYKFPAVIIRPSNNYGPWQYPEKLVPLSILKLFRNEKIPVYATGKNVREWLFVEDCAAGVLKILKKGSPGKIYNLGGSCEKKNIEVVKSLLSGLRKGNNSIEFVKDRPGHDIRYSLDSSSTRTEIGWSPNTSFQKGIKLTTKWYFEHQNWLFSKWQEIRNHRQKLEQIMASQSLSVPSSKHS
ncbi:MAG: dTDP-glucose 4,6-dehydratase [Candidatus Omnitrophica bacterium]|nr:dTDP-glucose 4,6-dehydratase [Candidatus Omnitrophota bacterium]MDD5652668.1 dTDP-glucose 4,6-dehydratase [Candidatus Omnitrophota bacterium]